MPSLTKLWALSLLACSLAGAGPVTGFRVIGPESPGWARIFSALGLSGSRPASIFVVPAGEPVPADWMAQAEAGTYWILEGHSAAARAAGFRPSAENRKVRNLRDGRLPELPIIWQNSLELPLTQLPPEARVFAREHWTGAPVLAGFRAGRGGILWMAAGPGPNGYERFPYLPHALAELGCEWPFQSRRLWAFFDSAYRARVDLDYFARRWRRAGIAALHVAAWHYWEPDPANDEYLQRLIEAAHRQALQVYAWIEFPHVSESFWEQHPEWREQTALRQDAHLDWRKLMNLMNPDCRCAVAEGLRGLLGRFDWDGVNLAELYFESLEGAANPARFTPLNDDVRKEFQARGGFDPLELFRPGNAQPSGRMRAFLDYRAALTGRLQQEWLAEIESWRRGQRDIDVVLTQVDDRFASSMRDCVGADAAAALKLLEERGMTFLVEDPATVWHLGPQRYPEIARRYAPLTRHPELLGVDINVVERYQNVYPTKQQTGVELLQQIHMAAGSFGRVALYFERSILGPDLPFLAHASAAVTRAGEDGEIESPYGVGVRAGGPVLVDGRPWAAWDGQYAWIPAGRHRVAAGKAPAWRLLDFNGELREAFAEGPEMEIAYSSQAAARAVLERRPVRVEIDGHEAETKPMESGTGMWVLRLPSGEHRARLGF